MKLRKIVPLCLSIFSLTSFAKAPEVYAAQHEVKELEDYEADYESWINSWSKRNHLYIHYNRGEEATAADYDSYALWLWERKPHNLEGTLWAFGSETHVSDKLTLHPMSTSFMSGSEVAKTGSNMWIDKHGAIIDVDLEAANLVGGKTGDPVEALTNSTEIGFLMVKEESMGGNTHWTSDGGKDTFVKDFDQHYRDNGSIHIFLNKGLFDEYTFESGDEPARVNPVTDDQTGQYRSEVEAVAGSNVISKTAEDFKSLGVGYQIFVNSFRDSDGDGYGDIRGIINSLDYLEELGAQVLWLTPIQKSDSYHGYDISDYYAVDEKYGTEEDYRELIYKAHKKGMKVLMDLVLNHTSKNNIWFKKSQWAEVEDGINWRNVYSWKYKDDTIQKYNHSTGKYETTTVYADSISDNPSWYRDGESNYYYYGKFGSGMPEINYENQATRDMVIDMAKYWMSYGLDGFRLDAVKHIYMKDEVANTGSDVIIKDVGTKRAFDDEKGKYTEVDFDYSSDLTKNIARWSEFANGVKNVYPNCFLVGENFDGWGARTAPYYRALDSQFDFAHYYHIVQYLYANPEHYGGEGGAGGYGYNEPLETYDAYKQTSQIALTNDDGTTYVPGGSRGDFIDGAFTSNHDVPRAINQVNGTWAGQTDTKAKEKITGTAQEIGRAKIHAAITLLSPGVSWIYYGDELGMSGNTDQHIAKYGNENSTDIWYRQPFKWGDSKITTGYKEGIYDFEFDSYNATLPSLEEQRADQNSMFNFYKALCEVKKQYPKNAKVSFEWAKDILVMYISGQGTQFKIFINCGYLASEEYGVNPDGYTFYKAIGDNVTPSNFASNRYSVLVYKK